MAKTRIKTTPVRMQKDAQMAMANAAEQQKKVIVPKPRHSFYIRPPVPEQRYKPPPTYILTKPANSSRSSTNSSTASQLSDIPSITSGSESSLPTSPVRISSASPPPTLLSPSSTHHILDASNEVIIETSTDTTQLSALMNGNSGLDGKNDRRKVFMITTDDSNDGSSSTNSNGGIAHKRKMLLIMEEDPQQQDYFLTNRKNGSTNESIVPPIKKKLTLFANKADKEFPQKFEKILPEILSRIQSRTANNQNPFPGRANGVVIAQSIEPLSECDLTEPETQHETQLDIQPETSDTNTPPEEPQVVEPALLETVSNPPKPEPIPVSTPAPPMNDNERLPITLPPKKNRTKIIISHQQEIEENLRNNSTVNFPVEATLPCTPLKIPEIELDPNYAYEIRPQNLILKQEIVKNDPESATKVYDIEIEPPNHTSKFHKLSQKHSSNFPKITASTPVVFADEITTNGSTQNGSFLSHKTKANNGPKTQGSYNSLNTSPSLSSPSSLLIHTNGFNGSSFGFEEDTTTVQTSSQHCPSTTSSPPPILVFKHHLQKQSQYEQPLHLLQQLQRSPSPPALIQQQQVTPNPIILETTSNLPQHPLNTTSSHSHTHSASTNSKNINLSTDFLFLMKMLPKLESIQEPRKTIIKNCIEDILTQNASLFKQLSL